MGRERFIERLLACADAAGALAEARGRKALCDEATLEHLDRRFQTLIRSDLGAAAAAARAAAVIARVGRGPALRATALRFAGVVEHLTGHTRTARGTLERAAALAESERRFLEAGDVHRTRIDVLVTLGDDRAARQAGRAAERCYARAGGADPRRRGSLAMNLGHVHQRREEHGKALASYAAAREQFRRAGDSLRLAYVDYNRANVLTSLDRTAESRRLFERAAKRFRSEGRAALVARTAWALAEIDRMEGHLDRSLARLEGVRPEAERLGDGLLAAHVDLESGATLLRLNRPHEAEQLARRARSFCERAGHPVHLANCESVLGGAALQRGRPRAAARWYRSARARRLRERNGVGAALYGVGLARAESHAGRPDEAVAIARRSAATLRRAGLVTREARALAVAAEAALDTGRVRAAERLAERATRLARRRRDRRVEFAGLMVLARLERGRGRQDREYRRLVAAERCVEALRAGVSTEESRLAFAVDKVEVYERLILNRLERGDRRSVRRALEFAERGKARALAERLGEGWASVADGRERVTDRLLARLREIERRLALAETRAEEATTPSGVRRANPRRLAALEGERARLLARLVRQDPGRAALAGAPPPGIEELLEALDPGETVLEYAEGDGHLHLFVIRRGEVRAHPRLASVGEVRDLWDRLRFLLGKSTLGPAHVDRFGGMITDTIRSYLDRFHRLLLGPVDGELDGRSLRIVPHGLLHGLPFHALESDGKPLIQRCRVSYVPSLAVVALLKRRARPATRPPLVLGVPDGAAPEIEAEVAEVRRHLRTARVFRGAQATGEAIRLCEGRPALLHVACHGYYSDAQMWSSGLRLGDAWLSLPEIYALRGTAEIVVLSGCETGRGTVYSGDEWVGLVRGFLQAGARAVVAALGAVHDQSAVPLMADFYSGLARGLGVAEAMAVAQRNAHERRASPLHWTPFAVVGDPGLKLRGSRAA